MNKPLNGRESTLLAFLANNPYNLENILKSLDGRALDIALHLIGRGDKRKRAARRAAQGFKNWAKSLNNETK